MTHSPLDHHTGGGGGGFVFFFLFGLIMWGLSCPTRGKTHAPFSALHARESSPLDHQGTAPGQRSWVSGGHPEHFAWDSTRGKDFFQKHSPRDG